MDRYHRVPPLRKKLKRTPWSLFARKRSHHIPRVSLQPRALKPEHAAALQLPRRRSFVPPKRRKGHGRLWLSAAACALLLVCLYLGTVVLPSLVLADDYSPALLVSVNGRSLGVIDDEQAFMQLLDEMCENFEREYGMPLLAREQIALESVYVPENTLALTEDIMKAVENAIDVQVQAYVIEVEGYPVIALKSEQEAQEVLDLALEPFMAGSETRTVQSAQFIEDVQIDQQPVVLGLVCDRDEALKVLAQGAQEEMIYTVAKGDTLWNIAERHGLRLSEIRQINPQYIDDDEVVIGHKLTIVKPKGFVNVRTIEVAVRTESLPYETQTQNDSSLYTTQTKVIQEGKNGVRESVLRLTRINGTEIERELVSETVIAQAQPRIVARGTKTVPKATTSAPATSTTGGGGYIMPVQGTFTSPFGQRWGRLHAGIDLAAPTGTPIYASRGGTVTYSGTMGTYGKLVEIDHGGGAVTRYAHCSKLLVSSGQKVSQGTLIALVGSTGNSTGPHLHFEIRINGSPINPMTRLK